MSPSNVDRDRGEKTGERIPSGGFRDRRSGSSSGDAGSGPMNSWRSKLNAYVALSGGAKKNSDGGEGGEDQRNPRERDKEREIVEGVRFVNGVGGNGSVYHGRERDVDKENRQRRRDYEREGESERDDRRRDRRDRRRSGGGADDEGR